MAKLHLSVAVGPYDRMRPLVDGEVQIDAVDPQFMLLEPAWQRPATAGGHASDGGGMPRC